MTEQTLERRSEADLGASTFQQATSESPAVKEISSARSLNWGQSLDEQDLEYIPVSPWGPISLCIGLLGLTGFIGYFGLYVAFFGVFVGIGAIRQIRSSGGFVKGTWMAATGLILSICSFCLGSAKMSYDYKHEVPEGYARVNFPKDVAEKQFVFLGGHRKLHPEVAALIGKKVYLKGFMWATQETEGLRQFILLKDNGECCFGGKPKAHDYIIVTLPALKSETDRPAISNRAPGMSITELTSEMKEKLELEENFQMVTRAYTGMVAVAGVLEADLRAGENGPPEDYEFAPVYKMSDVELVEEAWTRF